MLRINPRIGLIAVVVLLVAIAGCDVDLDGEPAPLPDDNDDYRTVPLELMEQQDQVLAFVPVTIAGEGPYLFALDTGASTTVVAADIAAELELPTTGEQRQVFGVIGADQVEVVQVDDWSLGDIALAPAEITMIDLPSPSQGDGLEGLLGSDVLSDFGRVVVDYDRERLELPPAD